MKGFRLANRKSIAPAAMHKGILDKTGTGSVTRSFRFDSSLLKAVILAVAVFAALNLFAQAGTQEDAAYKKTISDRSAKIVNTLGISDSDRYGKVMDVLMQQYFDLNRVHDGSKAIIASIKEQHLSKEETADAVKGQEEKKAAELQQLHADFIARLKQHLSDEQVDLVKDGMTYRVFPITYKAYQDMLPKLTEAQKLKIYNWLKDARELAMDEGSSDDKHKVFGKYKGRINNYLSAEGYDLKKETEAWQQRTKSNQ